MDFPDALYEAEKKEVLRAGRVRQFLISDYGRDPTESL